jgi:predicted transcriptional regulator
VEGFGKERGLARGTIVKMADRLLKKGLLTRRLRDHVFVYAPARGIEEIESEYVRKLVDSRFQGDVSPVLAFLSEHSALDPKEREALHRILDRLGKDD